jgi:hypothetical protein
MKYTIYAAPILCIIAAFAGMVIGCDGWYVFLMSGMILFVLAAIA